MSDVLKINLWKQFKIVGHIERRDSDNDGRMMLRLETGGKRKTKEIMDLVKEDLMV